MRSVMPSRRQCAVMTWALLASALCAAAVAADDVAAATPAPSGLVFPVGKWDFKIKTTLPGESRAKVTNVSACMNGAVVTPGSLMPWLEEQGCRIVDLEVAAEEMEWKLECDLHGQPGRGRGRFEIDGKKAKGRSKIDIRVAGNSVSMATKWFGEHVGPCDPPSPLATP